MQTSKLSGYHAYPKQQLFHNLGSEKQFRLLMAGNQMGKSFPGAAETAIHATGFYPSWWRGHRFVNPPRIWVGGETALLTRDSAQVYLAGKPGEIGTGFIPLSCILNRTNRRGVSDAIDTLQIRHASGGVTSLTFKSYDQKRKAWQAEPVDFMWLDEEPPKEIFAECKGRTNKTMGKIIITFTPLLGMSEVVKEFWPRPARADSVVIRMELEDAEHIKPEDRAAVIAKYQPYERDARIRGIPAFGTGLVYGIPEETIWEDPLVVPSHWAMLWGLDFGYTDPTAAVLGAHDRDRDVLHIVDIYMRSEQHPSVHAAALRSRGDWIKVAWPKDGYARDNSGYPLADEYRKAGVRMLKKHASFPDGSDSVEAGISKVYGRLLAQKLKVARHLEPWFEEYRTYHRIEGVVQDGNDHLMDATRYLVVMLSHARPRRPEGNLPAVAPSYHPFRRTSAHVH